MNTKSSSLYVVRVLPMVRGFRDSEATYFSSTSFLPGSLISIPFRNQEKWAVVLSSKNLAEEKSQIKAADFGLRKIKPQKTALVFSSVFLNAVQDLSLRYASAAGEILSALVPSSVLDDVGSLGTVSKGDERTMKPRRIFLQGAHMERSSVFIAHVSKTLKDGSSVLILAPTIHSAKEAMIALEPHFQNRVNELTSRLTKKKQREVWSRILVEKKPSVTIVTTGFLSLPQKNIGLCVILQSGSGLFLGQKKPYLDGRVAMEVISKKYGAHLLTVDVLIPLRETSERTYKKLDSLKLNARVDLIDMANIRKTTEERLTSEFTLLSKEILVATETFLRSGKNVFWFVSRRGLFPGTVCRDCGREHVCSHCGSSLVLHKKKGQLGKSTELLGDPNRFFLCHRCSRREDTLVTCRNCNSWRLMPLGIGVDRVAEEARDLGLKPIVISQDTTPTKKSVREAIAEYSEPSVSGKLLVGTDLAIPAVDSGVPFSAVVSLDSRLAIPSYSAEESTLRTLLTLVSLSSERCLVQTRRANHRVFKYREGFNLNTFRKEEMELRCAFLYPPRGTLIEISFVAKKEKAEERLASLFRDIEPLLDSDRESALRFPLRGVKKTGYYKATLVVRITDSLCQRSALRDYLLLLSPSISVRIDPENL